MKFSDKKKKNLLDPKILLKNIMQNFTFFIVCCTKYYRKMGLIKLEVINQRRGLTVVFNVIYELKANTINDSFIPSINNIQREWKQINSFLQFTIFLLFCTNFCL